MKIAAINIPPLPPRPAGGESCDSPRAGRATFADIRDRVDLERRLSARLHLEARDGEARFARWRPPAEAEASDAALEIQLPREAFTATVLDDVPAAALDGRPASLTPPTPGTPAAAYARAAALLGPELTRGAFFSAVV